MKGKYSVIYLSSVCELPSNDRNDEDGNTDVRCNEVCCVPVALEEDGKTGNECDDDRSNCSKPGSVWLPGCLPGKSIAADALDLESPVKADVAEAESSPCDETSYSAKVEKPVEGLCCATSTETLSLLVYST